MTTTWGALSLASKEECSSVRGAAPRRVGMAPLSLGSCAVLALHWTGVHHRSLSPPLPRRPRGLGVSAVTLSYMARCSNSALASDLTQPDASNYRAHCHGHALGIYLAAPRSRGVRSRVLLASSSAAAMDGGYEDGGYDGRRQRRRTLACSYAALCSLIVVKATVAQSLPLMLTTLSPHPERVAGTLSMVAAGSAALEFALLPVVAALSDTVGRRPLLIALPLLTILLRLTVVLHPTLQTLVLSRIVVGALVNYFDLFVAVTAADLYAEDADALASLEGKTAAAWGAAYAGGMLIGGRLLARTHAMMPLLGPASLARPLFTYVVSASFGVLALGFALLSRETLPKDRRVRFALRGSSVNPLGFLRLFRSGKLVAALAAILALQTLHDGEGDVWQVYGADVHGWGTRENSLYGAAVGLASTTGGLLTGRSVRWLGNRRHTAFWTLSTAISLLLFMTPSAGSRLAALSVMFCAAEDCMSAAVCARLVQAGSEAGLPQGQLAGDVHNLSASVRVVALSLFGWLYLAGVRLNLPSLPYLLCAATQFIAFVGVVLLPAHWWRSGGGRAAPPAGDAAGPSNPGSDSEK